MCGILGQFSDNIDQNKFISNLLKLKHRGPDDYGVYFDKNIALGHTRLSILDLSQEGHQPMMSFCNNYVIIYNGEIYNFQEIKKNLINKGYKFHSNTDTEVILNGFIEYREKLVNKLNGMFAFAIYDKRNNSIFLARDKSGIKPLYYYKGDNKFIFASEMKSIDIEKEINFEAKILFFLLGYVPEPWTIYKNILMFPAGYYGYYKNNKLKLIKYDEYKYEPKLQKTYIEIVKETTEIFENSVKRHLISDAQIGTFLSGGLDSSAITAIAAKYKNNLQTLSLVFNEKDLSEEYYQDLIVKKFNTKHTKFLIDEKLFLETINNFFNSMEQPTIDGLNTYFVSLAAKKSGLKTVLSGVGGDEIFYGYPSFKYAKTLKVLSKIPCSLIKIFEYSNKFKKLELLQAEKELAYYLPKRALFSPNQIAEILNIDKKVIYKLISELWHMYNTKNIKYLEDKISFFELNMYMKNQLVRDTDVFGMAHSLEIRVPFLDKELVDYVLKIHPKMKFGSFNKQVLVEIVKDILPKEIYDRKKMGFTLPFEYWFRKNIEKFDMDNNIKEKFKNGQISWARFWAILVLEKFK